MYIYAGSASNSLARKVAESTGATFGTAEVSRFSNDELRVWVKETKLNNKAVIVQSLSTPVDSNIIEFCLLADTLHRLGVQDLYAVIPWLAYSKQDKVFRTGEPLSVKVIARILQTVPIKRLFTFDLHNLAILGFFDIPVTNLSARTLFTDYFKSKVTDKTVVVAPDAGAIKSSNVFATELGVPVAYIDKKRDLATGKVSIMGISRQIEGAQALLIDDMIVTGDTLVETAGFLKSHKAETIAVAATHHLYVKGAQSAIEKSGVDQVVVTDTIEPRLSSPKLTVLSVSDIVSQTLADLTP